MSDNLPDVLPTHLPAISANDPLAPYPGETSRALEALHIYVGLGPSRTLAETARRLGHSNKVTVEGWSRQWSWQDRLQKHILAVGRAASLKLVERRAAAIDTTVDDLNEIQSEAMSAWAIEREKPRGRRDVRPLRIALQAVAQRRKLLGLDLPPDVVSPESPERLARREAERAESEIADALAALAEAVGDTAVIDRVEALLLSVETAPTSPPSRDPEIIRGEIGEGDRGDA